MIRIDIAEGEVPWDFARGLASKLSQPFTAYAEAVYAESKLPLREFEGARIRIAQINGCERCLAFRTPRDGPARADRSVELPEDFYTEVERWRDSDMFSERERLAIDFAERFATNHRSFDDDEEIWEQLHEHFSDAELMDLAFSVGACMVGGRFGHVFGLDVCDVNVSAAATPAALAAGG